jgi:diguanylate cyclase (GGDEF)-like protein
MEKGDFHIVLYNILTSGHSFSEEEHELRLKYIFFNALLIFNILIVCSATLVRIFNAQYFQAMVDIGYILCALIVFALARHSRSSLDMLMYFVIFFSYVVVTLLFYNALHPLTGTSWYILVLMITFIFKGRKVALAVFAVSLLNIILISKLHYHYTVMEIFLGLLPYSAVIFFLYVFNMQNEDLKHTINKQKSQYKYLSLHDALTGIPNRSFFFSTLKHSLEKVQNSDHKVALLFIDLDDFKTVNDTLGHHVGDAILKETAFRIQSQLRSTDIIARYGGDEFSLILSPVMENKEIEQIIKNILNAMDTPVYIDGKKIYISLSIGIAVSPTDGTDELQLLTHADHAMYHVKKNKSAKYCFYENTAP